MILRTRLMLLTAIVIGGPVAYGQPASNEIPDRPNIILIMCDDLGYGDLKSFDPESPIHTPHLEEMAASGLQFTRFYSAAPVCSPTRGSCLTGRHPYRYGIHFANTGHLKREEITLPEILQKQGYRTGHFGKWHLGTLTATIRDANRGGPRGARHLANPADHGYDTCLVTESKVPTWDPMIRPVESDKFGWDAVTSEIPVQSYGTRYWNEKGEIVADNMNGDDSRVIVDRVLPFVEGAVKENRSFFAAVWFHAPHLPVVAGQRHVQRYRDYPVLERNYYGCVTAMDEQVGRLRNKLAELKVEKRTIIFFCSDNGPEGKKHEAPGRQGAFRGRKRSLYEGGVRVCAIVEMPGVIEPGKTSFPSVTSDYLPTLLAILGTELPDNRPVDGVSLLPVLTGQPSTREKPIGFQSAKQAAWHEGDLKIYSRDNGDTWELYDLSVDPGEENNLATIRPEVVKAMNTQFLEWRESCRNSERGADYPADSSQ